jgi:hypothetical protein
VSGHPAPTCKQATIKPAMTWKTGLFKSPEPCIRDQFH